MSFRDSRNPKADEFRKSRFVLRTDTKEIYSVDKYVWPIVEEIGAYVAPLTLERCSSEPGLATVFVCADQTEYEITSTIADLGPFPEDRGLVLVGFDLADATLISGLLDCEYSEDELTDLRPVWESKLNEYHLFFDVSDAIAFRQICNARVPEHAPFAVYQLWIKVGSASTPLSSPEHLSDPEERKT